MKRLAIYFFYDAQGVVGDYVPYFLEKLREHVDEICVVVNAPLAPAGREKLQSCSDKLLVRENVGFDSGAYRHAILDYGFDKIGEYDELLLCNFTFYGPVFPLAEMFSEMDGRKCDLWGINRHPGNDYCLQQGDPSSRICEHIQSYFLLFRNKLLRDSSFAEYWNTLKVATTYEEAIIFHELRCAHYFEDRGFISDTYMDYDKYKHLRDNASLLLADQQHMEDRCPLVKRKLFYLEGTQWISQALGHTARDMLDFVRDETDYPIDLIWKDLLRTQKMSVLRNNLHLDYSLSKRESTYELTDQNLALVLFVYYDDLVDYCCRYLKSMPKGSTVYIISAKQDMLDAYREHLAGETSYTIEYRLMENSGRDVGAYLVAAADVYEKHDYLCMMHDKKTKQVGELAGREFSYHCFENNLASPEFVRNVVQAFDESPYLGMLVQPPINIGLWYFLVGYEMTLNENVLRELYKTLELTIPFDDRPVAPYGTMFWVRGKAFRSIFNHKWEYKDFPKEPIATDGTILHATERIYPMTVQQDGYYVGYLTNVDYTSLCLDNQLFMLGRINQCMRASGRWNIGNFYTVMEGFYRWYFPQAVANSSPEQNAQTQAPPVQAPMPYWLKTVLKRQMWRYRLLACITFGKRREHYRQKKRELKFLLLSMQG